MPTKYYTVREALKLVFNRYAIARETGDAALRADCREFIRSYWHLRHNTKITMLGPLNP